MRVQAMDTTAKAHWLIGLKSLPGIAAGRAVLARAIEQRLGIATECPPERFPDGMLPTHFRDPVGYVPLDYDVTWWCMRPVRAGPDDVLFDIGCGMGRVLCMFARRE